MGQTFHTLSTSNVILEDVARHNENYATLKSNFSGTTFPSGATAGQKCWRTDRGDDGMEYTFCGNTAMGESGWLTDDEMSAIALEVANSRGSKATLNQRLDVIMNEDGTLKGSPTAGSQWVLGGYTFTYVSSTVFKTSGNTTDIFVDTRRVKVNLGGSYFTAEILGTPTYDGTPDETTVTIDTASIDATLVSVEHSLIAPYENEGALSFYNRTQSDEKHRSVPMRVKATEAINKGEVVTATGYNQGEDATEVTKTVSQTDIAVGITFTNATTGQFVDVITRGIIEGLDTSAYAFGTILYSNGSGGFTDTKPIGAYQAIAYVIKNHATTGAIMVNIAEPNEQNPKLWQNQAVPITPPTDADYTLTATENGYGRLILDLSNWTQARNIIVDNTERSFIVDSPATNAYTATVKTSAGTGKDVLVDTAVWLLCDGTDVIESVDSAVEYNPAPIIATGSATFTNSTNNIALTGIGIGVEIGDVIQVSGSTNNDTEFTIEVITDDDNVIVNQAHAGETTSKALVDETATVTVKLLAKSYNASDGLGQGWVNVTASRVLATTYINQTNRSLKIAITGVRTNTSADIIIYCDGAPITREQNTVSISSSGQGDITKDSTYSINNGLTTVTSWFERR